MRRWRGAVRCCLVEKSNTDDTEISNHVLKGTRMSRNEKQTARGGRTHVTKRETDYWRRTHAYVAVTYREPTVMWPIMYVTYMYLRQKGIPHSPRCLEVGNEGRAAASPRVVIDPREEECLCFISNHLILIIFIWEWYLITSARQSPLLFINPHFANFENSAKKIPILK